MSSSTFRVAAPAVVVLSALASCQGKGSSAPTPDPGPVLIGREDLAFVERTTIDTGPRLSGSLEAARQASIRAEVGGSVVEVTAEIGDPVRRGQPLARIEDLTLRNAHRSAESALRASERDLEVQQRQAERTERLAAAGALAARDVEVAQAAALASEARVAEARSRVAMVRDQLQAARVSSPIDGVVSKRSIGLGDVVAPGAPLFTVIDPSSMRLEASVSSEHLGALGAGTVVAFEVRGYEDRTFTGKIARIAPAVDPETRQIPILVDIPNPGGELVAGLFAEGRVATEERQALVVPISAIDQSGTRPAVTRVRDGKTERVQVELGIVSERIDRAEIVSGVEEGDAVLIGASRSLAPGTAVEVGHSAPAASARSPGQER